jgi:hypothetical protein
MPGFARYVKLSYGFWMIVKTGIGFRVKPCSQDTSHTCIPMGIPMGISSDPSSGTCRQEDRFFRIGTDLLHIY